MPPWWGLALSAGLLGGYAWLAVLAVRVRSLHRRLAVHVCRDPQPVVARRPVTVAELLERERGPGPT